MELVIAMAIVMLLIILRAMLLLAFYYDEETERELDKIKGEVEKYGFINNRKKG